MTDQQRVRQLTSLCFSLTVGVEAMTDARTSVRGDETLESLQLGGLLVLQKKRGFRFGMDAVLLSDFAEITADMAYGDYGTGTGILPLLLHGRGKGRHGVGLEIQPDYADMARRTMRLNGLEEEIEILEADVRRAWEILGERCLDAIVCNPPYGTAGKTMPSADGQVNIARHQETDGLVPWFRSAHRLLRGKGRFYMVYPAAKMLEAMDQLNEAHLTPKRFRLVYPDENHAANLVLLEAVKDGRPFLTPCPPLIISRPDGTHTDEMKRIYHTEDGA